MNTLAAEYQTMAADHAQNAMWDLDDARSIYYRLEDSQDREMRVMRGTRFVQKHTDAICNQILSALTYAQARKLLGIEC